jgi:regulator of PEP synthase PpsR (kinase-PPPase family)
MVRVASVALGFRLIFCWRNPESFAEARAKRLLISSNSSQYDDLTIFIREQQIFQQLVKDSAIPKLLVDVTERSLEEQIDHIADWLEATGGLNPAESPANGTSVLCMRRGGAGVGQ